MCKAEEEIQEITNLDAANQLEVILGTKKEISDLKPVYEDQKRIKAITHEKYYRILEQEKELDSILNSKDMRKRIRNAMGAAKTEVNAEVDAMMRAMKSHTNESIRLREILTELDSKDGIISKFNSKQQFLEEVTNYLTLTNEKVTEMDQRVKYANQQVKDAKKEVTQNKSELKNMEDKLNPLFNKSSDLTEKITEAEQDLITANEKIDLLSTEWAILNRQPEIQRFVNLKPQEWQSIEERRNEVHQLMDRLDASCQVFNICGNLENSLTQAKTTLKASLENADADAFTEWLNKNGLPNLNKIQIKYGTEIAELIKGKGNIIGNLPNFEGDVVNHFTDEQLSAIKQTIETTFGTDLTEQLDIIVKRVAYEKFQGIWSREEGLVTDVDQYVENAFIDILS